MTIARDPETIAQKIAECWQRGASIQDTQEAVKRCLGETVTFDQVQRQFADLSWIALR